MGGITLADGGFGAVFVALVVGPVDDDLVARLGPLDLESQVGVLGHAAAHFGSQHRGAVDGGGHFGDEVGGHQLAGLGVFTQTGFHRVVHQHFDVGDVACHGGTDTHGFSHLAFLS